MKKARICCNTPITPLTGTPGVMKLLTKPVIYAFLQLGYGKHNGCTAMMKLIEKTFIRYAGAIGGLNQAMDEAGV